MREFTGDTGIGGRETQVFEAHLTGYAPTLDDPLRHYHGAFFLTLSPLDRKGSLLPLLIDHELTVA